MSQRAVSVLVETPPNRYGCGVRSLHFFAALLFSTLPGCMAQPRLIMPVDQVRASIHTVCVGSIASELRFEGKTERLAGFEVILVEEARRGGWTVVEPARFVALAREVETASGGSFDPVSGEKDVAKAQSIAAEVRRMAREKLGCDGFLYPSLAMVRASWADGIAMWDGVQQPMGGSWSSYGYLPALSLWLRLKDYDDREVFFGTGGVQVLSNLESTGFLQRDFVTISEQSLLANPAHMHAAVAAALSPFLPRPPPSRSQQRWANSK